MNVLLMKKLLKSPFTPYLQLFGIKNIGLIAFVQCCIKFGWFRPFAVSVNLDTFQFFLLVLASVCIASAGHIAISLYSNESIRFDTNFISEKYANQSFLILNILGVGLGTYLSYSIHKPVFAGIFVLASCLLYVYATTLSEIVFIRNLVIGFLGVIPLLVVGIFELIPIENQQSTQTQLLFFSILLDYSILYFLLVIIMALAKDMVFFTKDQDSGLKTIPVVLGYKRTLHLLGGLAILTIIIICAYSYTYLYKNNNAVLLLLGCIIAPLLYITIKIFSSKNGNDFNIIMRLMRGMLCITASTFILYQFILK